jgi:hypothetical protein
MNPDPFGKFGKLGYVQALALSYLFFEGDGRAPSIAKCWQSETSVGATHQALRHLRDRGLVEVVGANQHRGQVWRLTKAGRTLCEEQEKAQNAAASPPTCEHCDHPARYQVERKDAPTILVCGRHARRYGTPPRDRTSV